MMAGTSVDPALFRLRTFEVEWIEPLKTELDNLHEPPVEATPPHDLSARI